MPSADWASCPIEMPSAELGIVPNRHTAALPSVAGLGCPRQAQSVGSASGPNSPGCGGGAGDGGRAAGGGATAGGTVRGSCLGARRAMGRRGLDRSVIDGRGAGFTAGSPRRTRLPGLVGFLGRPDRLRPGAGFVGLVLAEGSRRGAARSRGGGASGRARALGIVTGDEGVWGRPGILQPRVAISSATASSTASRATFSHRTRSIRPRAPRARRSATSSKGRSAGILTPAPKRWCAARCSAWPWHDAYRVEVHPLSSPGRCPTSTTSCC